MVASLTTKAFPTDLHQLQVGILHLVLLVPPLKQEGHVGGRRRQRRVERRCVARQRRLAALLHLHGRLTLLAGQAGGGQLLPRCCQLTAHLRAGEQRTERQDRRQPSTTDSNTEG